MNLTPCPECKHVWANMMRHGGNAVRIQGTAIDNLGRVSKRTSEILNGHEGERIFSVSEGEDHLAILKNMSMT